MHAELTDNTCILEREIVSITKPQIPSTDIRDIRRRHIALSHQAINRRLGTPPALPRLPHGLCIPSSTTIRLLRSDDMVNLLDLSPEIVQHILHFLIDDHDALAKICSADRFRYDCTSTKGTDV